MCQIYKSVRKLSQQSLQIGRSLTSPRRRKCHGPSPPQAEPATGRACNNLDLRNWIRFPNGVSHENPSLTNSKRMRVSKQAGPKRARLFSREDGNTNEWISPAALGPPQLFSHIPALEYVHCNLKSCHNNKSSDEAKKEVGL